MLSIDHINYHRKRAEEEFKISEQATDPAVAKIHRELAILHRCQEAFSVEVDRVLPRVPQRRVTRLGL